MRISDWSSDVCSSDLATILRQAPADARASIAAWRQISDILAQRGNQLGDDDIRRSLHALAVLRRDVPEKVRRDCARAVARHGRFAPLVAFYANDVAARSEEHTSELQSLMRISYAVFCLKKKN